MEKQQIKLNKGTEEKITQFELPLRYALLAKKLVIKGENRRELLDLMVRFLGENDPQGETQNILCEEIIFSVWMLRRMREHERNHTNRYQRLTEEEKAFSMKKKRIRNIKRIRIDGELQAIFSRQEKLEKQMAKALKQLRSEQLAQKIK